MTDEITDLHLQDFDLPGLWQGLREAVIVEKRILSQSVFERVWQIFITQYAGEGCTPVDLTREYQREEFLLVVSEAGKETGTSPGILQLYHDCLSNNPVFARWFQEARLPGDQQVVLAARWLCHLIGLRHYTVEIFIDPPNLDGHTLVQVRGMDKYEAPGAYDIPCAGHVSGVDPIDVSLRKELAEELNLSLEDLLNLHSLGEYNSYSGSGGRGALNNEYRFLYRARLKASAVPKIGFIDGEVAGLAVFSVPELRALVERFPERVASGLSDAMVYYR